MDATSLSPAVVRMIGTVGAMVSFQEGSDLLTELAGVAVDTKQVERTAEVWEKSSLKMNACTPNLWILFLCRRLCISVWMEQAFLYAPRTRGRTGKQPDGSAKTGEVNSAPFGVRNRSMNKAPPSAMKVGHLFRRARECFCIGYRRARSPFAQRVWREATRRRFCQASRRSCSGMAPPGSGISPTINFRMPPRSLTAFTPSST